MMTLGFLQKMISLGFWQKMARGFLRYFSSAGSTSSRGMSLQCWVVAVTRRVGRHVHEEAEPPASAGGGTMPENAAVHVKSCND